MNRNIIFHYQYIGINNTANKSIFFSAEARGWKYTVPVRPYPQAMSGVGTFPCFSSPSYRFCINAILITFRNGRFFSLCFYTVFWSPITLTISLHVMVYGHYDYPLVLLIMIVDIITLYIWNSTLNRLNFGSLNCVPLNKITLNLYNKYPSRGIFKIVLI